MEGPGQTSPLRCRERRCRPPQAPAPRHPAAWHACSRASAEGGSRLGRGCGGGCPAAHHPLRLLRRRLVPIQQVHGGVRAAPDPPWCTWASPRGCPQLLVGGSGARAGASLRVTMAAVASALPTGAISPRRRGPRCQATIAWCCCLAPPPLPGTFHADVHRSKTSGNPSRPILALEVPGAQG